MRTNAEMVLAVHERMKTLRERQERKKITVTGSACAALGALMIGMVARFGGLQHAVIPAEYSGASLVSDDIGGYVLVAIGAFMAGAAATVAIRVKRRKDSVKKTKEE